MGNRYTDADIEVHLPNYTDGIDAPDMDEEATMDKVELIVREALLEAFDYQYRVAVFSTLAGGARLDIHAIPKENTEDAYDNLVARVEEVIHQAVNIDNLETWLVEKPKPKPKIQPKHGPTPEQIQEIYNLLSYLATQYEKPVDSLADAHQEYDLLGMQAHNLCVDLGIPYDDAEADESDD